MAAPDSFWFFQFKDFINSAILVATIVAIVWGPVKAVEFTRNLDEQREKRRRRFEIFHALMKTRKMTLSPDHVSALNLIQLEFHDEAVIRAYKAYIELLYRSAPPMEQTAAFERFFRERDDGFFDLIHEIGKCLGYSFDRRELDKFSYAPQGWNNDENQVRVFRHLVIDLLNGRRALPVANYKLSDLNEKFPPPPS